MKRIHSITAATAAIICSLSFACVLCGCQERRAGTPSAFGTEVYAPSHARMFRILGDGEGKSVLIEVLNPWQGADSVVTTLLVLRDGETAPGGYTGPVLQSEPQRIVAMSSTHIALLDALGECGRIAGVASPRYISSPSILARLDSIADVGYEPDVDYERIVALSPDLVLLYGINGSSVMERRLDAMGIPYLYVADYLEESPLGKAEWIVPLAEITGDGDRGRRLFDELPARYDSLCTLVRGCGEESPAVMLNTPYGDSWVMPGADSYMARLIADAGGAYILAGKEGNSSTPVDIEDAYRMVCAADLWLNVGRVSSLSELATQCPKFTATPCFRNRRVYNNNLRANPRGGNDFFESGIVHPDLVLRDLIKIFHPSLIPDDFVYYRQLD